MAKAYIVGTCDTKGAELRYMQKLIEATGVKTCLVDIGTSGRDGRAVDVSAADVAAHHPKGVGVVLGAMIVAVRLAPWPRPSPISYDPDAISAA